MAVSYVGVTSGSSGSATSTSFATSLPSGWAAGDVAVLVGHVSGSALTMTMPAGWTPLPGASWPVTEDAASRLYAWSRVLQAGDTPPTIANSGSMTGAWECTVCRGTFGVAQAATTTASGTAVTLPTLTGVGAGSALVVGAHCRVASGAIPTGLVPAVAYTEVVDQATSRATTNANVRADAAYRLVGSAGSYGGEQVTSDVAGSMVGLLVELAAASADAVTAPDGIAVPAAVGAPSADWSTAAVPDGISVSVAVGGPSASWTADIAPVGVPVPVAVGGPSASWTGEIAPGGLLVPVAVGAPGAGWSADTAPVGLAVPVALGEPLATWSAQSAPGGISVPVEVGAPSTSVPGRQVHRPYSGTVARPGPGVVVRPNNGVVVRP